MPVDVTGPRLNGQLGRVGRMLAKWTLFEGSILFQVVGVQASAVGWSPAPNLEVQTKLIACHDRRPPVQRTRRGATDPPEQTSD